ncbi:MAG: NUDIX hydrolase [Dehalococcoidia bacterium]|nr:NUDIX hydrolase [Dehalococcoidia bacterium]
MSEPGAGWRGRASQRPRGQYCPDCGGALFFDYRGGERPPTCPACGYVRVRYPGVVVAVIVRDAGGRVLMGRRSQGGHAGLWCIPCGRLEWDEDVRAAAIREFQEETGLEVELGGITAVHSNFHDRERQTVGIWFSGRVVGGRLHAADGELSELAYFDPATPPELAFPTDALVLRELAGG